ncbi:MAG: hypothetical protein KBS40_00145 [Bacteroidales bacterium]|nr:hypothetical protein [Bacteroidales bacterium]
MKKFFLFAATLLGLVACNKNEADINVPARQITIHATADMNNGSAASGPHRIAPNDITASSVSFHWQEGDKIWVFKPDFSEKQLFTIVNSSINGNQADFTGTALSDMSLYYVAYDDNNANEEMLMALASGAPATLNYRPDGKNWVFSGQGIADNFSIKSHSTVRMQLKGSCKLGKVTYLCMSKNPGEYLPTAMSINFVHGEYDGLQLSETPIEVTLPLSSIAPYGFTIRFYDTDDNLILEKSKTGDSFYNAFTNHALVNLGVIEVAEPFVPTYVDLGLPSGLKWATCNVGATAPEGYGDYFAWGETEPKDVYDWSTYFDSNDGETFTKYYNGGGKTVLDPEDDAAHVNWGGSWRMPTYAELDELKNTQNCEWKWCDGEIEKYNNTTVKGYLVTSKTNSNSIFLPASGFRDGSSLGSVGFEGYYRSSSLCDYNSSLAYYLLFGEGSVDWGDFSRYRGLSVRPVCTVVE